MEDWKAKQAARQSAAKAMQAAFPSMIPAGEGQDSLTAAAKNMRIELKAAFPGIKFSVKSRRFSGGDAIDVSWIDGPCSAQVDEIIDKYTAGSFDGMTDCYDYSRNAWTDAFGDAKYVHSRRDLSDKAIESAIRTVKAKYGTNLAAIGIPEPTVASYRSGTYWSVMLCPGGFSGSSDLQSVISSVAYGRCWALTKKAAQPAAEVTA